MLLVDYIMSDGIIESYETEKNSLMDVLKDASFHCHNVMAVWKKDPSGIYTNVYLSPEFGGCGEFIDGHFKPCLQIKGTAKEVTFMLHYLTKVVQRLEKRH